MCFNSFECYYYLNYVFCVGFFMCGNSKFLCFLFGFWYNFLYAYTVSFALCNVLCWKTPNKQKKDGRFWLQPSLTCIPECTGWPSDTRWSSDTPGLPEQRLQRSWRSARSRSSPGRHPCRPSRRLLPTSGWSSTRLALWTCWSAAKRWQRLIWTGCWAFLWFKMKDDAALTSGMELIVWACSISLQ